MKVEAWIFGSLVIFFAISTPIYWLMSKDPTGTAALIMTFLLVLMIAAYLGLVARRIDPRPEDKKEGRSPRAPGNSASSRRRASGRCSSAWLSCSWCSVPSSAGG